MNKAKTSFKNIYINNDELPWWISSKECACNVGATGDMGSIPGSERFPAEGNSHPLQWGILWTEEPGRLQYGRKELGTNEAT